MLAEEQFIEFKDKQLKYQNEVDNKSDLIEDSIVCKKLLFLTENNEKNTIPLLLVEGVIEITIWKNKYYK
ncbi:5106_t:CDS:2, partial [Scutellospora calospora]